MTESPDPLRAQLARILDWQEAHVGFDKAVDGIPPPKRGALAAGFEHSCWQLLEHMRLAQHDILDYCANPKYVHALNWPDDYWPPHSTPTGPSAWEDSVASFKDERGKLKQLALDTSIDLHAKVPTGKSHHTYLRAILLVADHNSYHLGQLVGVRRALGIWP